MKALAKLIFTLTAVAAVSVAYPAKANLITNPGFEASFTGWTFSNGAAWAPGAGAHSGVAYGFMPSSGANSPTIAQSVATTAGASYTISFFVACAASIPSNLSVNFGGTVFNHLFAAGNNGYTQLSFTATTSGANTNLSFTGQGVASFRLDDVSVEPAGVGVPDGGTTVSLLGCALLGLAHLRRKLSC
jgi:protein with PEP-CTERM/exosortase system signal